MPPEELLRRVQEAGITHFAITDHDTTAAHSRSNGFAVQPSGGAKMFIGVEINTSDSDEALHILGFGSRLAVSLDFQNKLSLYRSARERRARAIVEKFNAMGIGLAWEAVARHSRESVGRPNIADALTEMGVVSHRKDAFRLYLLPGKLAYVPPLGPSPQEAIQAIREAGGLPVLAHPGVVAMDDKKLSSLVREGLRGIEAYHPLHSRNQTLNYLEMAKKNGLLVSGGSDFHGPKSGREELIDYKLSIQDFSSFLEAVDG